MEDELDIQIALLGTRRAHTPDDPAYLLHRRPDWDEALDLDDPCMDEPVDDFESEENWTS